MYDDPFHRRKRKKEKKSIRDSVAHVIKCTHMPKLHDYRKIILNFYFKSKTVNLHAGLIFLWFTHAF